MKIGQALRDLSQQPMQEQNLLSRGLTDIKEYFQEKAFVRNIERQGYGYLATLPRKSVTSEMAFKALAIESAIDIAYHAPEGTPEQKRAHEINEKRLARARVDPESMSFKLLQALPEALRDDKELVLKAIHQYPNEIQYASVRLKDDKTIALAAVDHYNSSNEYTFLSERLRNDEEVAYASVIGQGYPRLENLTENMKNSKTLILRILDERPDCDRYIVDSASNEIKEICARGDPTEQLTKALNSEKLAATLTSELKPKSEKIEKSLKI